IAEMDLMRSERDEAVKLNEIRDPQFHAIHEQNILIASQRDEARARVAELEAQLAAAKRELERQCEVCDLETQFDNMRRRAEAAEQQLAEARECINEIDLLFEDDYPDVVERVSQLFDRTLKAEQQLAEARAVIERVGAVCDESMALAATHPMEKLKRHIRAAMGTGEGHTVRVKAAVAEMMDQYDDDLRAMADSDATPPEGGDDED
ncbi:MAG: hypothetical protein ABIF77_00055, partial [bacterium]